MSKRKATEDINERDTKQLRAAITRFMLMPPDLRKDLLLQFDLKTIKKMCGFNREMREWCQQVDLEGLWLKSRTTSTVPSFYLDLWLNIINRMEYEDLIRLERADPIFARFSKNHYLRHYFVMKKIGKKNLQGGPYPGKLTRAQATAEWAYVKFKKNTNNRPLLYHIQRTESTSQRYVVKIGRFSSSNFEIKLDPNSGRIQPSKAYDIQDKFRRSILQNADLLKKTDYKITNRNKRSTMYFGTTEQRVSIKAEGELSLEDDPAFGRFFVKVLAATLSIQNVYLVWDDVFYDRTPTYENADFIKEKVTPWAPFKE